MPKMNKDAAKRTAEAENTGGVMEPGIYIMRLAEVVVKPGEKGPYWKCTFKVPEDTAEEHAKKYKNWNQWLNISEGESSDWKRKEFFEAFGVPTNTDTDELIGRYVRVTVDASTIQSGPRTGEASSKVSTLLPLDTDGVATVAASGRIKSDKPLY